MNEGYSSTGDSGSMWGNLVGQVIGAWTAREVAQEQTAQTQAKELATPYRYNNPQALAAPKDNTMTYVALGGVALAVVVGLAIALRS